MLLVTRAVAVIFLGPSKVSSVSCRLPTFAMAALALLGLSGCGGMVAEMSDPLLPVPVNHGLGAGEITIRPGSAVEHGNVQVSCPSGGRACLVFVSEDGTVSYRKTGGVPVVKLVLALLPGVRSNHAIPIRSRISVNPGDSEVHGKVVVSCPAVGASCIVEIGEDGAVHYRKMGGVPGFSLARPERLPELPLLGPLQAVHHPVIDLDGTLHVGPDVAPPAHALELAGVHDGVKVSSGRVRDGVGAAQVLAYLNQVMGIGEYKDTVGLETFSSPPTVRVAEGTSERFTDYAVRAVQLINAAVPLENRIRFSGESAPPLATIDAVPDGEIHIDFAPWAEWNAPGKPPRDIALGLCSCAKRYRFDGVTSQWTVEERRAAHVWIERDLVLTARVLDPDTMKWERRVLDSRVDDSETIQNAYSAQDVIALLVHEILHAMGMHHLDPGLFPNSIMSFAGSEEDLDGVTGHVLYPVDREALLAAYSAFRPGTLPGHYVQGSVSGVLDSTGEGTDSHEFGFGGSGYSGLSPDDLGPWDDTAFHLRGTVDIAGGAVSFGVASRNGLAQPWTSGPTPWMDLEDNPLVPETALWSGRLLGLTPAAETVAGAANLRIYLETMAGELSFTDLENWGAHEAPGPVGTGILWKAGELQYDVAVRRNTFFSIGNDEGTATGAFFGHAHQAMGGTLERADLTASFAGTGRFKLPSVESGPDSTRVRVEPGS